MPKVNSVRKYIWIVPLVLAIFFLGLAYYQGPVAPSFPNGKLVIERADGKKFSYQVDIATTPEQERYGLMFRRAMPEDSGMIFIHKPVRQVSMWMKNTYIPLDMLFVKEDGSIVKIVTHAKPLDDKTIISSDVPVSAVIELNAGQAEKHDFKVGDKVLFQGLDY